MEVIETKHDGNCLFEAEVTMQMSNLAANGQALNVLINGSEVEVAKEA